MSDIRALPLRTLAQPGRFGNPSGTAGVTLSIIHPVVLASVIARKDRGGAIDDALKGIKNARVMWAGADQYFVEGMALVDLKAKLGDNASVIDQSHGRVVIRVAGPKARAVLAKGTPVDLHDNQFPVGKSALTQMAHVGVHITRTDQDEFTLSMFRGFSESFWEWLEISASQFGFQVF
jgi:methylglutamate dehydrogenase subunit D